MSPIVEAAVRALCRHAGNPENATMDGKPLWQDYVPEVFEVLIAIRDASDAMAAVGRATAYDRVIDLGEEDAKAIYTAMLDAVLWDAA
jgi:hypothetical protein